MAELRPIAFGVAVLIVLGLNALGVVYQVGGRGVMYQCFDRYYEAARWIGRYSPPDAVIACRKASLAEIESRRTAIGYPWVEPDKMIAAFRAHGVTHIIVDQLGFESTRTFLVPALNAHAELFEIIHATPTPPTYVVRFRRERL